MLSQTSTRGIAEVASGKRKVYIGIGILVALSVIIGVILLILGVTHSGPFKSANNNDATLLNNQNDRINNTNIQGGGTTDEPTYEPIMPTLDPNINIDPTTGVMTTMKPTTTTTTTTTRPPITTTSPTSTQILAEADIYTEDPTSGTLLPLAGGRQRAPTNIPKARSYGIYQPVGDLHCSKALHDSYHIEYEGKIYPTWHPTNFTDPKTKKTCFFGHEHGMDPKGSRWENEELPFGYTNELSAGGRNEDHVGHKVQWINNYATPEGNDPSKPIIHTCSCLIKLHQGLHSPDAFSNSLHENFYFCDCSDGRLIKWKHLHAFGAGGQVMIIDGCPDNFKFIQTTMPDVAGGDGGERKVATKACLEQKVLKLPNQGNSDWGAMGEHWVMGFGVSLGTQLQRVSFNPYYTSRTPARYFDPTTPKNISYLIDACYMPEPLRARGPECDRVRTLAPNGMRYDDPRSPFKGTTRSFSPNRLIIKNTGPTTIYTDAEGHNIQYTPFPNSIKQFAQGNLPEQNGDIFMPFVDNDAPGVHSPN